MANKLKNLQRTLTIFAGLTSVALTGCTPHAKPAPPMQAMPVQTAFISLTEVPISDEYVATIKSRRSATLNPQVDGNLTQILVHSGQAVKAGQLLMVIDPARQEATVASQRATEVQKRSVYEYNQTEIERQRKLFEAGVTSHDAYDQAQQAFKNSKADYESAVAVRVSAEKQLGYYRITAPFAGIVGDIPVHLGDYVSGPTLLTTVDEPKDLEAYIYLPTERASQVKPGIDVELTDTNGNVIERTKISFISPQVDSSLQGILVKAPVHATADVLRNAQLVKAHVIWGQQQAAVIPVLATTRLSGQAFVYVVKPQGNGFVAHLEAVKLGDTLGNTYAVLDGLKPGDELITSGLQFLADGAPVLPLRLMQRPAGK